MADLRVLGCRAAEIFADPGSAALFAEYATECANALLGPCAPRPETYAALEASGLAQCFAAYQGKVLSGFAFVLITELSHYEQGRRFAIVESLFVSRVERASGLGGELMEAVSAYARKLGCTTVSFSAPVGSRLARLLFLSEGRYMNTHHIFVRSLM
jgi:GNAT superfamily N-acetyltransferase